METASDILRMVFAVLLVLVWAYSVIWCAADARARHRSGWVVGILVAIFWPWAWLMWFAFRPDLPAEETPGSDHIATHPGG